MEVFSILGDIIAGVLLGGIAMFLSYIGFAAILELVFGAPDER